MLQRSDLRDHGIFPSIITHAENIYGNPAPQVNVSFSIAAFEQRALPPLERDRETAVCMGDIFAVLLKNVFHHFCASVNCHPSVNMVPIPSSVSVSIRIECGILPSIINTLFTPLRIASIQHSTFGIMPPEMIPSRISVGASLT